MMIISTVEDVITYYNMTVWICGAKLWWLPLVAGCVKLEFPVSISRVRQNGECVQAAVLMPVSIWFIMVMLKPRTST